MGQHLRIGVAGGRRNNGLLQRRFDRIERPCALDV